MDFYEINQPATGICPFLKTPIDFRACGSQRQPCGSLAGLEFFIPYLGVSIVIGTQIAGWFISWKSYENLDDLGVPLL